MWTNKAFQITKTEAGYMGHGTDDNGVIIFRWRMYYETQPPGKLNIMRNVEGEIYEEFNVPFGVIENFETFKALCRQF